MTRATPLLTLAAVALLAACAEKTAADPTPGEAASSKASPAITGAASAAPASAAPASATPKAPPRVAATPSAAAQALPYRPPAVARALSAAHTTLVTGVEGLDWLFRNVARVQTQVLPALPPEVVADLPPQAKDPKSLPAFLDFAPETPAGWQGVGVQPGAGLAVILDDRLFIDGKPSPLLAAQITEQGRFLAWLNTLERKHGPGKGVTLTGQAEGACKVLRLSEAEACLGVRRGVTLLLPLPKGADVDDRAALTKAFTAIIEDAGPTLADKPDFKASLRTYPGTPAAYVWVDHKLSGEIWAREKGQGAGLPPDVAFFLDRFPASAIWYGRRGAGLQIRADQAGAAALARIFQPTDGPPDLAALVGPRTAFYRLALNLPTLFEGVADLVPPSRGQVKGQIILAKNMIPLATGVAWEDLVGGLTGHAGVLFEVPEAFPPAQPDPHSVVAVLGVKDAEKAQRALDAGLKKLLEANPKLSGPPVTVAGREVPSFSPLQVVAIIDGERLFVGTRTAVERTLAAKHTPPASVRETLEERTFVAFGVPFEAVWSGLDLPADVKSKLDAGKVFWDRILTDGYMAGGLRVDREGLSSSGGGAVLMPGILAAVAIPAFIKYIRRAKASQARLEVMRLTTAAEAYKAEHGQYPPSAPLTPAESACPDSESGSYQASAAQFTHPTWKALSFPAEGQAYYRYEFVSDGQTFTARALGDLDCDGVQSTFERTPEGGLVIHQETE